MADPTPKPRDFFDQLRAMERRLNDRIDRRTGFDGSQLNRTVQKLEDLVSGLLEQVNGIFSGYITAQGIVTGIAGMNSPGVYNNLVSTGAYKVQYINVSGAMGYVPSSLRYKQEVETAPTAAAAMLAMRVVTFRYAEAVKELGDAATVEWGVIAEEMHELGLTWLVDYDADGQPEGVKYERLVLAVIPVVQDHEARLCAAGL